MCSTARLRGAQPLLTLTLLCFTIFLETRLAFTVAFWVAFLTLNFFRPFSLMFTLDVNFRRRGVALVPWLLGTMTMALPTMLATTSLAEGHCPSVEASPTCRLRCDVGGN